MALKEIKVETQTIEQISDIIKHNPEGSSLVQKNIVESIDKLWRSIFDPKSSLVLVEDKSLTLIPKSEHCSTVKNLVGKNGPYTSIKRYKSWVGLSEGVYQLEGCDTLVPVSWFEEAKHKKSTLKLLTIALIIISLIQSLLLLIILI